METIYITIDEIEHAMRVAKNTNSGIQLDKLQTLVLIDHLNNVEGSLKRAELAESELAKVLEQNRWRKYPDEKPENGMEIDICFLSGRRIAAKYKYVNADFEMAITLETSTPIGDREFYWRPLPSAPQEEE
jgi:hypothetical protein